jgi:hypothetical protein
VSAVSSIECESDIAEQREFLYLYLTDNSSQGLTNLESAKLTYGPKSTEEKSLIHGIVSVSFLESGGVSKGNFAQLHAAQYS